MLSQHSSNDTLEDLMKPDEDWRLVPDNTERRRLQNRIAQRVYRRNLRQRTKQVESLQKEIRQLQEVTVCRTCSTCQNTLSSINRGHIVEVHNTDPPSEASRSDNGAIEKQPDAELATSLSQVPRDAPKISDRSTSTSSYSAPRLGNAVGMDSQLSNNTSITGAWSTNSDVWSQQTLTDYAKTSFDATYPTVLEESQGLELSWLTLDVPDPSAMGISVSSIPKASHERELSTSTVSTTSSISTAMKRGDSTPKSINTLFHLAVASGNADTLRLLLRQPKLSSDHRDVEGYTPLQRAVLKGRSDMVAIFLEHYFTERINA